MEVLGRTDILYKEAGREMVVYAEVLATPRAIGVWKNTIRKWRAPYESEPISEEKHEAIIENIRQAIRFSGGEIQVVG